MDAEAPLDVLIVGAGISGIGMAAHLAMDAPAKTYALLERRARLGGIMVPDKVATHTRRKKTRPSAVRHLTSHCD